MLNDLFSAFDELANRHGLEKIRTMGDSYMAVAGAPSWRPDHTQIASDMALEMLAIVDGYTTGLLSRVQIRIGINTGPVTAGVIGKQKFVYDVYGDTVNTASRMVLRENQVGCRSPRQRTGDCSGTIAWSHEVVSG
jgi:adenylate cyclase